MSPATLKQIDSALIAFEATSKLRRIDRRAIPRFACVMSLEVTPIVNAIPRDKTWITMTDIGAGGIGFLCDSIDAVGDHFICDIPRGPMGVTSVLCAVRHVHRYERGYRGGAQFVRILKGAKSPVSLTDHRVLALLRSSTCPMHLENTECSNCAYKAGCEDAVDEAESRVVR